MNSAGVLTEVQEGSSTSPSPATAINSPWQKALQKELLQKIEEKSSQQTSTDHMASVHRWTHVKARLKGAKPVFRIFAGNQSDCKPTEEVVILQLPAGKDW